MASLEEQLEIRRRMMRRMQWEMTPEQRLERFDALIRSAFAVLKQNPEGYARFIRRNYRKRAAHHGP